MHEDLSVSEYLSNIVNPNLLVNSNFREGIVNQRGNASYSQIYTYGIDMWYIISNGTETVKANSITASCDLKYFFEKQLPNNNYTLTVSSNSVLYKFVIENFNGTSKRTNLNIGGKNLGVELISNMLILYMNGNTHTFDFIKLEQGRAFTGMPVLDMPSELLKCYRRYWNLYNTRLTIPQGWDNQYGGFLFPVEMVKVPTMYGTYEGIKLGYDVTTKGVSIIWVPDGVRPQTLTIGSFIADANFY